MTINSMSQGTTEVVMEALSFVMDYTQDLLSSVSHLQISFRTSDQVWPVLTSPAPDSDTLTSPTLLSAGCGEYKFWCGADWPLSFQSSLNQSTTNHGSQHQQQETQLRHGLHPLPRLLHTWHQTRDQWRQTQWGQLQIQWNTWTFRAFLQIKKCHSWQRQIQLCVSTSLLSFTTHDDASHVPSSDVSASSSQTDSAAESVESAVLSSGASSSSVQSSPAAVSSSVSSQVYSEETQGRQEAQDTLHQWPVEQAGAEVQWEELPLHRWASRLCCGAGVDRDPGEDLVPEQESQVQEDCRGRGLPNKYWWCEAESLHDSSFLGAWSSCWSWTAFSSLISKIFLENLLILIDYDSVIWSSRLHVFGIKKK